MGLGAVARSHETQTQTGSRSRDPFARAVRAQNLEGLAVERLGLCTAAGRSENPRQLREREGVLPVGLAQRLAVGPAGLADELLGLGVVAAPSLDLGDREPAVRHVVVALAEQLDAHAQGRLE